MTEERWLPVVGYEGLYEVSDRGRVRSLDRWVRYPGREGFRPFGECQRFHKGTLIKPHLGQPPMCYLAVRLSKDGRQKTKRIHVLVLEAFVSPRPQGMEACHNNSQPHDNRPENLRWDTRAANMHDIVKAGRHRNAGVPLCKRKHEFTPENTYVNPTTGGRTCRQCIRDARGHKSARPERFRRAG